MNKGFTLVELSIVLVIIGLLIGGVLVAQSLIDSSKINAQIQQLQQFDVAIDAMYSKYDCIPGDCRLRYELQPGWNTQGNGNGYLNHHATLGNFMGTEMYGYFVQLSKLGYLKENYTTCNPTYNCDGSGNWSGLIGEGGFFPETKIVEDKGIAIVGGAKGGVAYFFGVNISAMVYYHWFSDAAYIPVTTAYSLDKKLDDGYASTGEVYASTNRETVNSTCGSLCSAYTDTTLMQLDTANGVCTDSGTPRTYNVDSSNLCRIVVNSQSAAAQVN